MEQELGESLAEAGRIRELENAIAANREAKKDVPDCPCWANAPQLSDADLYRALDGGGYGQGRLDALEEAIQRHRDEKQSIPECTCWVTVAAKADQILYAILESP